MAAVAAPLILDDLSKDEDKSFIKKSVRKGKQQGSTAVVAVCALYCCCVCCCCVLPALAITAYFVLK